MSEKSSKFFALARTTLMVTVIAVLLWLMAEAQMVQSQTVNIRLVLLPNNESGGNLVVRPALDTTWERTIEITLEGATSELDLAVRQLGGQIELAIGQEIPVTTGIHDLDLRALLRQQPAIQQGGVRVAEVIPEIARVEVDELVSIDIPVRVELPAGVEVQGTPQSEPATVRLMGPSNGIARMQASGLDAVARVPAEIIGQLTPGRSEIARGVLIDLETPGADRWETTLAPKRVDVRILLRSLTETLELPPMPVQVMVAPDEVGRYLIEIAPADRDVVSVVVSGPSEAIESIRSKRVVPTAFLALTLDQLESRVTSAPIRVQGLPAGVRVVGSARTVSLTIRPVESVGGSETPGSP